MKCRDPFECPCFEHKRLEEQIPACPEHRWPLRRSRWDSSAGECLFGCLTTYRHPGDPETVHEWLWLPRDLFDGEDLPPFNGFEPIGGLDRWA